jgi:hypothetical protein
VVPVPAQKVPNNGIAESREAAIIDIDVQADDDNNNKPFQ